MSDTVHATAVIALGRAARQGSGGCSSAGVLIRGPSGSGKSTLAAALVGRGGILVADDRVHLSACHGRLVATALDATAGLLELRGRGIAILPHERTAVIRLVVDIVPARSLERLPDPAEFTTGLLGMTFSRQPVPDDPFRAILLIEHAVHDRHRIAI